VRASIYLVPGFFGFANLGELRYFAHVRQFLRDACRAAGLEAVIYDIRPPPTASLPRRASRLLEAIAATLPRGSTAVHLIGHSSGGLDARLLASPGVALPAARDVERVVARLRSVVTVASPHHGTPVASFFTGLLGQRALRLLSLVTVHALRFGHPPLAVMLRLGAVFARLDRHLGVNSALLDQLFDQLLADFSPGRRRAIGRFLGEVRSDQALLTQLTPEGMEVFNALARDRPGVRYGSVVTSARPPGMRSLLATGFDPAAQATHALYQALYRLAASRTGREPPSLTRAQARTLARAYGQVPDAAANDGVVPTLSQVWGDVIHAARGDHHDVIGNFDDPRHVPPHFDWLATGTGFDRPAFEALWTDVARYLAAAPGVISTPPSSRSRGRSRSSPRCPRTRPAGRAGRRRP